MSSVPDPRVDAPISFRTWATSAHLKFIKARAPFSAFLSKTLHLSRRGVNAPASVLMPLPVPYPAIFRARRGLSSRRRAVVRLLRILVMALNFIYWDCAFVPCELLCRPCNGPQAHALAYLEKLLRTYGSDLESVVPSSAGPRMNILQARVGELSERLGQWDPTPFLFDELRMAFVEPRSLLFRDEPPWAWGSFPDCFF